MIQQHSAFSTEQFSYMCCIFLLANGCYTACLLGQKCFLTVYPLLLVEIYYIFDLVTFCFSGCARLNNYGVTKGYLHAIPRLCMLLKKIFLGGIYLDGYLLIHCIFGCGFGSLGWIECLSHVSGGLGIFSEN